jgi:phosphoglycolate phosphatase-like HAD superfamily hydrolase
MIRSLIFDVDGTLVDAAKASYDSYQKVFFEEFGRYFTEEERKAAFGFPTKDTLTRLGFPNVEAAAQKYHCYLMEAFCRVEPFPGMVEVLDRLRQLEIPMGIVTSRVRKEVEEDACAGKLIKYFQHMVCADDTRKHKPDPEPLLKILEHLKIKPEEAIYMGDTHYDSLCAEKAGVAFALALWGAENHKEIRAEYYLREPGELLKLLEQAFRV